MPRGPRPDAPGLFHHVTHRGVGRRDIFLDDADREDFLARVERLVLELGFLCFAWALMSNHFHLALRAGTTPLATLMARLATGYARYFNERHGHVGHLFQNRYGSRVIRDDADLTNVVAYVNRNPLEAGIVSTPESLADFPWTSHGALMGARRPRPFEVVGSALRLFGDRPAAARRELGLRMAQPGCMEPPPPEHVWRSADAACAERADALATLVAEICAYHCVHTTDVRSLRCRRAQVVSARAEIARRAVDRGFTRREISQDLRVSESAVCRLLRWKGREAD